MPPKVLRRTLTLAGFDVPVIELTGSAGAGGRPGAVTSLADGPNLGWLADVAGRC